MALEFQYNGPVEGLDLEDRNREIKHLLAEHNCEVTFTKVDGTVRTMPCTLQASALPKVDVKEGKTPKVPKADTISVWCLDKSEWRAFKVANVTQIRVLDQTFPKP